MKILFQKEFETPKEIFEFLQEKKLHKIGIIVERGNKLISVGADDSLDTTEDAYVFIVNNLMGIYYGKLLLISKDTGKIDPERKEVLVLNKKIILEPEYIIFKIEPENELPEYLIYCENVYANINEDGTMETLNIMEPN
jgi:hypothetical protein